MLVVSMLATETPVRGSMQTDPPANCYSTTVCSSVDISLHGQLSLLPPQKPRLNHMLPTAVAVDE